MQQLMAYAKAEGLRELTGETLAENATLITMAKELGFEVKRDLDAPDVMSLRIELAAGRAVPQPPRA
jgi:acetyltransferase